jgi:hypothetical protein
MLTGPITIAIFNWAVDRATSPPEIAAGNLGLVDAWRLMLVCVLANTATRGQGSSRALLQGSSCAVH